VEVWIVWYLLFVPAGSIPIFFSALATLDCEEDSIGDENFVREYEKVRY